MWPKGDHSGDIAHLVDVKNVYVHPYPLTEDEDRFSIYLSKDKLSDTDKANVLISVLILMICLMWKVSIKKQVLMEQIHL